MTDNRKPMPIRRFFAGLAEYAFESQLGVADPPLVDYLAELLTRFVASDAVYTVRNLAGRRLHEVADMVVEADARVGEARREIHRHIGDFTLFWTGVYPEALLRLRASDRKDYMLDYCEEGKRAYYIASKIRRPDHDTESDVLERLSHDFEVCVRGLAEMRREWERRKGGSGPAQLLWLN